MHKIITSKLIHHCKGLWGSLVSFQLRELETPVQIRADPFTNYVRKKFQILIAHAILWHLRRGIRTLEKTPQITSGIWIFWKTKRSGDGLKIWPEDLISQLVFIAVVLVITALR